MKREGTPLLVVENLRKDFGNVRALSGIDIVLDAPGVYGFLGPNGAGKTTTFKIICGLLRPTGGRVFINGHDVHRDPKKAFQRLGVQFDAPAFYPYLTGRENLQVVSIWAGRTAGVMIDQLLFRAGLQGAAQRRVEGYSWGMKQRLGLASALLFDPQLVLLDEPTNGLDPGGIADIRNMLPRLAYEEGRTVFLSSHRMEEVEQVCDHVTIIHRGAIAASGTPGELATGDACVEVRAKDVQTALGILGDLDGVRELRMIGRDRLRFSAPGSLAAGINRLLVEGGVDVEEIVRKRETLEDIFFRLTGIRSDDN